ncbi:alcohol dehydrogenase [Sarocladium strictum]
MALPTSYTAFRRTTGNLPRTIEPSTEALPQNLGPKDVLIKIHAVSLNYRDVGMLVGNYPVEVEEHGIPCSDCAAEVVAIGSAVEDFQIGDRVSPIFNLSNVTGAENDPFQALGGDVPGVLREYAVFEDRVLVHLPKHLAWEDAATLTCAGVTAWVALNSPSAVATPSSAILQGTGGVSMFALLICLAAGIKPIITSSSDAKLEQIKKLSPEVYGINYKTCQDQAAEVLRATDGRGVDVVVNNTGVASIPDDISFLRTRGGTVSLVGFLDGAKANWHPNAMMALMGKAAKVQGIAVGSKVDYQNLNKFLEEKNVSLAPVIDRVFPFQESKAAFDHLLSGKHVGKVIIKM